MEISNRDGFDLDLRVLMPGQWVDVKDTVNQWLEAQVLQVRRDGYDL